MLLPAPTEDDNIINVRLSELLTVSQNVIHRPLESGRSIVQAKRHHFKLKEAEWGSKGSLSREAADIGICQYPLARSRVEMIVAEPIARTSPRYVA